MSWFLHQVQSQLSRQLDEPVVPGLGNDENILNVGTNASAA